MATGCDETLSHCERSLVTACEFWASIANQELHRRTGTDLGEFMRVAKQAFADADASAVARRIGEAMDDAAAAGPGDIAIGLVLRQLEADLAEGRGDVDDLLERYATRCIGPELPPRHRDPRH